MSATATRPDPAALARLQRLESDPNLRHSGARWRAHEACYPGRGAADLADRYVEGDAALALQVSVSLAEFREKAPDDEAVPYLEWLMAELCPDAAS